ncbi:hypothetical protein T06_2727 [Trichinella sp. T6]|nr:hypothetical protein T06_2727 [Trichinella sp. T6]
MPYFINSNTYVEIIYTKAGLTTYNCVHCVDHNSVLQNHSTFLSAKFCKLFDLEIQQ